MVPEKDLIGRVSLHAVTRYVQRVLGVVVDVPSHELPPNSLHRAELVASRHCVAVGKSIEDIRRLIMTPAVALASATGVSMVSTRDFQAQLAAGGIVATIIEPRQRATKKLRVRSDRELAAAIKRHSRKMKRRPASCSR